ncbi:MAG: hypothetical protein M1825_005402 [Sarcosagium campestre]|nr:MAG: hypothetical protein M1825_005402 [Sarcosagium campestre]
MAGGDQNGEGSTAGAPPVGLFGDNSTSPPPSEEDNSPQSRFMPRSDPAPYRATGVEFAADGASPRQLVSALREVIFAAGSLHSAQLLQLSGVGPQDLLAKHDIPVNINLPGVGNNLQDHYLVGTFYPYNNVSDSPARLSTNETYNAEARAQYYATKQGPWTAGSPNGVAFPSLPDTTNTTSDILAAVDSQSPSQHLVDDLDPTLVAGFSAQKDRLVELLGQRNIGAWEIINNNIGSLTVSVMHPFSRGTCHINSANPFEPPIVDPRYGSNPVDLDILAAALLFNRRILATPPMQELQPAQFVPPIDADMDAIMQVIKNGVRTEFHPSGTCAMLPRERGGVVDTSLRVYGTQNLRVVDAGIMPLIPAAHLQAPVYAVAERAADLIKADNAVDGTPSIRPAASGSSALYQATASSLSLGKSSTFGPSVPSLPAYSSSSSRIQTSKSSAPAYVAPSALISSVVPTTSLSVLSSALPVLSGTSPPAPSVSSVIASIISAIVPQLPTPAADGPTPGTASAVASSLQAALNSVVSGLMPPPSTSGAPAATSIDQTPAPSAIASSVASVVESIVSNLVPTIPEPVLPSLPPANTAPAIELLRSTPPTSTPPPRSTEQVQALQAAIQQFVRWLRTLLSTDP